MEGLPTGCVGVEAVPAIEESWGGRTPGLQLTVWKVFFSPQMFHE